MRRERGKERGEGPLTVTRSPLKKSWIKLCA